ncbi:MAG: cytochrome c oxidase subunit II [Candidatus Rokuibacteriota bacterium]|nr:MAG: cytochrome c oxidase subunit II [Candidatus Rokubacteria bacterium]
MKAGAGSCSRFVPFLPFVTLAAGCALDTPQSSLVGRSDLAHAILGVYAIITWAAAIIALVVFGLLGFILIRYRDRPGAAEPRQTRGHSLLEISWTIAPALVLLIIAVPTIQVIFRTQGRAAPGSLEVVVRGWQWWWEFQYPGLGVVTANELHLPVGRPVLLNLEGSDVIHSFWVPPLGGKRDVVPGRHNRITFTPEVPGEYLGQCAEFCGAAHANMRLRVIVQRPEDFERWVSAQKAPPVDPAGDAAAGQTVYASKACVGCHTIRGVSAGVIGPDLTHFGSRRTLAAGLLPNTPENLVAWLRTPDAVKPGVKMPSLGLSEADARAVATYLLSLK